MRRLIMDIFFFKPAYGELQQAMAVPPADRKAWATIYQKAVWLAREAPAVKP